METGIGRRWVVLEGQVGVVGRADGGKIQVELYESGKKLWRSWADVTDLFGSGPRKAQAEVGDYVRMQGDVARVMGINGGRINVELASKRNRVWRAFVDIEELPQVTAAVLVAGGSPVVAAAAPAAAAAAPASASYATAATSSDATSSLKPASPLLRKISPEGERDLNLSLGDVNNSLSTDESTVPAPDVVPFDPLVRDVVLRTKDNDEETAIKERAAYRAKRAAEKAAEKQLEPKDRLYRAFTPCFNACFVCAGQ